MAVSRFPSRPSRTTTPRHVWLAGLGLIAVTRRQAVVAGSRLSAGAGELKVSAARLADAMRGHVRGVEPTGVKFSADVEARLSPVLDKLGLSKPTHPVRKVASAVRSQSRGASRAPAKRQVRKH